jgi:hypothetical protein
MLFLFGGGWSPLSISGNVLWLRADKGVTLVSGRVSQWDDQSRTGDANKNVAQATAGKQPLFNASDANLGGRPSFTFSKTRKDRLRSGTWAVSNPSPATWFAVGSLTSRDTGGYTLLTDGIAAAPVRQALLTSNTTALAAYAGSFLVGPTDSFTTGKFVMGGVFGTSGKLYVNARTAIASGTTGTGTLTGQTVGNDWSDATGNCWDGEIAEVIGYNRALSQAEVETVLAQLGAYYNITIGA